MSPLYPKPRLRDVLRNSLFGWGAMGWISPRRRRVATLVFPISGLLLGLLFGVLNNVTHAPALDLRGWLVIAAMILVLLAGYVAYDVNVGLELLDKRAVEADLDLARQIQRRMLPDRLPQPAGYELAAHHRPARAIGGDAYDALVLDDGKLLLAVADVSGKGASAALLMMGVLARLRALARTGMGVAELARRVNEAMAAETEIEHFSTLVIAELEPETGAVDYVNAGNTPPLVVRADGTAETLGRGGLPVGMLPGMGYEAGRVVLERGDRLLLLTDGVQDADEDGTVLLDDEELRAMLAARREARAEAVVEAVVAEVDRRLGDQRFDDVTLLLLGRRA